MRDGCCERQRVLESQKSLFIIPADRYERYHCIVQSPKDARAVGKNELEGETSGSPRKFWASGFVLKALGYNIVQTLARSLKAYKKNNARNLI